MLDKNETRESKPIKKILGYYFNDLKRACTNIRSFSIPVKIVLVLIDVEILLH